MSLGGPLGPGGLPPPPLTTGGAVLRQLAQAGWIEGRVSSLLGEGGARIATALGLVLAPEAAAGLAPGDRVRLRLNPQTGRIEAELLRPGGTPGAAAAGTGTTGAAAAPPIPPAARAALLAETLTPHLPAAAMASLEPILPGAAGALVPAPPPPGSPLYGLIAALFPGQSGPEGPRKNRRARRGAAYGGFAGTGEPAEEEAAAPAEAAAPPRPPQRDPLDIVDWTLSAGHQEAEPQETSAEAAPSAPPPPSLTEALAAQFARLSGRLPGVGAVQLDARRLGDHITLEVSSEAPLPAEFARQIRSQAEALARAWEARLSCSFRHGPFPDAAPA